jgi:hypothetical protein
MKVRPAEAMLGDTRLKLCCARVVSVSIAALHAFQAAIGVVHTCSSAGTS